MMTELYINDWKPCVESCMSRPVASRIAWSYQSRNVCASLVPTRPTLAAPTLLKAGPVAVPYDLSTSAIQIFLFMECRPGRLVGDLPRYCGNTGEQPVLGLLTDPG